ncbi:MAG: hypothetical protein ABFD69_11215 [Candidatus Sumerlaeia bacterium]
MAKSRQRKWMWVMFGVFIVIPALIAIALSIAFRVNALRPGQIKPPAGMLKHIALDASPSSATDTKTSATLVSSNAKDATAIWDKWAPKLADSKWQEKITLWRPDQPMTEEQKRWLLDNQELIADAIRLANLGGLPMMTCEEALERDRKDFQYLTYPSIKMVMGFQGLCRIVSAESHRRMAEGDVNGAVEALMAVHPLAQSYREPDEMHYLVSIAMQSIGNRELSWWLANGSIPADAGARIRKQLEASEIGPAQFRRVMEYRYESAREDLVRELDGSLLDLIGYRTRYRIHMDMYQEFYKKLGNNEEPGEIPVPVIYDRFREFPLRTTGFLLGGTGESVFKKASGSRLVDQMDNDYQAMFNAIDNNTPLSNSRFQFANTLEMATRSRTNAANHELNLGGLDLLAGGGEERIDPFTAKPLKTIQETESTLIYSLGPDLQDQRGAIRYDPTNGTMSAGDIWVKVRKK